MKVGPDTASSRSEKGFLFSILRHLRPSASPVACCPSAHPSLNFTYVHTITHALPRYTTFALYSSHNVMMLPRSVSLQDASFSGC